jgi:hypothetical protein
VQENDAGDWYSDSDGVSSTEDSSESGDEQYGVPRIVKLWILSLIIWGVDSASSELGDAFPIEEEDIEFLFCDALEDHPFENNVIPTANESRVSAQSGVYIDQRIHPSHLLWLNLQHRLATSAALLKKRNC